MTDQAALTAIDRSGARRCRSRLRRDTRRPSVPVAWDRFAPSRSTGRPGARRRRPPSVKIDGAGADLRDELSDTAGRLQEAATDVVAWQSDGVGFSRWPPL